VALARPYFYCPPCQQGFAPLDEALQLSERRKQWDRQKAGARWAAEVPFETAQELFAELTGLSLSGHTVHAVVGELSHELDVLEVSPTAAAIAERVAELAAGKTWRPVLVLAIDGAFVPTRPEEAKGAVAGRRHTRAKRAGWQGEWKEAKGFRFSLVDADRIVHVLSWHQIQDPNELFAARRQGKEAGLIPEEHLRLCVVAAGAQWIWHGVPQLFPTAEQLLDYSHCAERVHQVATAHYSTQPEQALEWVEATMARLFAGEVAGVIWGWQRMRPASAQATAARADLIRSLQNNPPRINYRSQRRAGYPLGSGGIESAHKFIGPVRRKRSSAWGYVA
jgi:hypothetical protein